MTNGLAVYSLLKPEMSSDSPSVRSHEACLVSARIEMNCFMDSGQYGKNSTRFSWVVLKV